MSDEPWKFFGYTDSSVLLDNKPLPEPVVTKISDTLCHH